MIICLMGFMGCGKSSVGRMAADRLGMGFADLDDLIESRQGQRISRIFAEVGEQGFREVELLTLREVLAEGDMGVDMILALGGGTPTVPAAAELLRTVPTVYFKASAQTIADHLKGHFDSRPLLRDGGVAAIENLLSVRSAIYESTATDVIDIDGLSKEEMTLALCQVVRKNREKNV